jgi:hypothetical protein
MRWIKSSVHFDQQALEDTLADYVYEVEHVAQRIERLEEAIRKAVDKAPAKMKAVIDALQSLRGVKQLSAVTIAVEVGEMARFPSAKQLMGYSGMVPGEYSSGSRRRQYAITKTGNAHLRRVLVEAAWAYQYRPWLGGDLLKRQDLAPPPVKEISWKAQIRLHHRYRALLTLGKNKPQIVTALGREMLGFIWEIGVKVETEFDERTKSETRKRTARAAKIAAGITAP